MTKYDCAKPLQRMETEVVVAYFTVLLQLWLIKKIKRDSPYFCPGIEPGACAFCSFRPYNLIFWWHKLPVGSGLTGPYFITMSVEATFYQTVVTGLHIAEDLESFQSTPKLSFRMLQQHLRYRWCPPPPTHINENVVLWFVVAVRYGCQIWYLTLREERWLRRF